MLRQVLLNLTGNAVKCTDTGEVVVRTAVEEHGRERTGLAPGLRPALEAELERVRRSLARLLATGP